MRWTGGLLAVLAVDSVAPDDFDEVDQEQLELLVRRHF